MQLINSVLGHIEVYVRLAPKATELLRSSEMT